MVPDHDGERLVVVDMRGRPGVQGRDGAARDQAYQAIGAAVHAPVVGAVGQDEVGVAVPGVVPGRLGLEGPRGIAGGPPRYVPDRDAAPAVHREQVRLDIGAQPAGEVVRLQPGNDRLLVVRHRGLGRAVAEPGQVAGQHAGQARGQHRREPHPAQPRPAQRPGDHAPGQDGAEGQHGQDLPGVEQVAGDDADRIGGDVDGDRRGQDGGDQVAGVEEVPERAEEAPHRQGHAGQVHHGERDPGGQRQARPARDRTGNSPRCGRSRRRTC